MREDFNKSVFSSLPNDVWEGELPDLHKFDRTVRIPKAFRIIAYAAAALSIPLAAGVIILHSKYSAAASMSADPIAQATMVYTVNDALHGEVTLPDSTRVILNSGSTLRYDESFGKDSRTVYLDGEGYFDVRKNKKIPFYIHTAQNISVKVTGTQFDMKCFSDSPKFDLTLIEGSVEITTPSKEIIYVKPSEEIVINSGFHAISQVENPDKSLLWTEGVLLFDNTPMREAISQIERWYGVKVVVADDAVYRNSFTAEFRSETLTEVLDLLCLTSRLSYISEDGVITLKTNLKK